MAITVKVWYPVSGLSGLTLEVYPLSGGTIVNGAGGDTLSQPDAANQPYEYEATITETLSAVIYQTIVKNASGVVLLVGTTLLGTSGTFVFGDTGLDANALTLLDRIGAFTGIGVNTVLGCFKAIMSKIASAPSDIGGTFDPGVDSLEALQEALDLLPESIAGQTIYVTPLAAGDVQRVIGTTITVDLNDLSSITVPDVTDANGQAIDLDAERPLRLVIENESGTNMLEVTDDDLDVVNTNDFAFVPTEVSGVVATPTSEDAPRKWALRRTSDNKVLAKGLFKVLSTAD